MKELYQRGLSYIFRKKKKMSQVKLQDNNTQSEIDLPKRNIKNVSQLMAELHRMINQAKKRDEDSKRREEQSKRRNQHIMREIQYIRAEFNQFREYCRKIQTQNPFVNAPIRQRSRDMRNSERNMKESMVSRKGRKRQSKVGYWIKMVNTQECSIQEACKNLHMSHADFMRRMQT